MLVGLIPFAALGIALGHVLTPDSIGPAMGGGVSLLAFLGGTWFPLGNHGFLHDVAQYLPSYWLVQASHVALGGQRVAGQSVARDRRLDGPAQLAGSPRLPARHAPSVGVQGTARAATGYSPRMGASSSQTGACGSRTDACGPRVARACARTRARAGRVARAVRSRRRGRARGRRHDRLHARERSCVCEAARRRSGSSRSRSTSGCARCA